MQRRQSRSMIAQRFASEARRFIAWADGTASHDAMQAPVALRHVVALYSAALALPQPWSEGVSAVHTPGPALAERLNAVKLRAAAIPLQHYSEIFSPQLLPPEAPVVGDLADDLVGIYADVALGLALHDAGSAEDAIWQWGFNFQIHWGEHASSAIRALHCYLSQEDPSGLSSDG
ncbi:MAG TPA: DUF5063 domain-containing protein [Albitalea sp.]|nr:DUF5063 domain-containing protein [Albitalea sp.]